MRLWQWAAVIVTVGLNAMDGFDVLSISFAAPGIAKEWGIDKAALGWVLSTELLGMAIGSVLLGGVADKIGRRPTILGCLVAMGIGMFGASALARYGHAAGVPAADRDWALAACWPRSTPLRRSAPASGGAASPWR